MKENRKKNSKQQEANWGKVDAKKLKKKKSKPWIAFLNEQRKKLKKKLEQMDRFSILNTNQRWECFYKKTFDFIASP